METKYNGAFNTYRDGAGDEFGSKKSLNTPPKMASYGSSSRMIYLYSRDIPNFKFEEKLSTTVGGIAHLDGYLYKNNTEVYVEAKCREPYSTNSFIIDKKYENLYRYIDESPDVNIHFEIYNSDNDKMKVKFVANGIEITRFDIKQMISHLLGIATKRLKTQSEDKIEFLSFIHCDQKTYANKIESI